MIKFDEEFVPGARIKVIGVGGGGSNAIDSMVESGVRGVDFYVINTDSQALQHSKAPVKIQIGERLTQGRGAGSDPNVGQHAATEEREKIQQALEGADMVFITAGLGGGTGTGAAPVVAEIARQLDILTVAVVTRPFRFEGPQRMNRASEGLDKLREFVDTSIIVSNDRLLEVVGAKATLKDALREANKVLTTAVSSISDLISVPGLINVDFADVRTIMNQTGGAVMGIGSGKGENRATEAVKKACQSPLLDKIVIDGARGVLICVTGGSDMRLSEINEATTMVYEAAAPDANIIFGTVVDETMEDEVRVTIIATGFDDKHLTAMDARSEEPRGRGSLTSKIQGLYSGNAPSSGSSERAEQQPPAEHPAASSSRSTGEVDPTHDSESMDLNQGGSRPGARPANAEAEADDLEMPTFLRRRRNLFE